MYLETVVDRSEQPIIDRIVRAAFPEDVEERVVGVNFNYHDGGVVNIPPIEEAKCVLVHLSGRMAVEDIDQGSRARHENPVWKTTEIPQGFAIVMRDDRRPYSSPRISVEVAGPPIAVPNGMQYRLGADEWNILRIHKTTARIYREREYKKALILSPVLSVFSLYSKGLIDENGDPTISGINALKFSAFCDREGWE